MKKIFLFVSCLVVSASILAHTPERLADPIARHGGLAKRAGDYNLEFVASADQIAVYVHTRGNRPLSTEGALADMLVMHDAGSSTVELLPTGGNRLAAAWRPPAVDEIRAVLKLTLYGEQPVKKLVLGIPVQAGSGSHGAAAAPHMETRDE